MKNILLIIFFLINISLYSQQYCEYINLNKTKIKTQIDIRVIIDNTSDKNVFDIYEIIKEVNIIYEVVNIKFNILEISRKDVCKSRYNLKDIILDVKNDSDYDLTLVFTGVHHGKTLGYAWVGEIFSMWAVGLVNTNYMTYYSSAVLTGHEIGHILGLKHNKDNNTLMYPEITTNLKFSNLEINYLKNKFTR